MALTPDQLDDFVNTTLKLFKKNRWVDISLEHQNYCALSSMITQKKIQERGGEQVSWRVQVKNTGNARNTGLFATDLTKVEDVMQPANLPWRMQTTNFSYDVYEALFQSDRETIIKELKVREHDAMKSMAELMEENLWTAPSSTSDERPHGIPYWITKDATTTPGGAFNGTAPAGHTTVADLNPTTYTRWRNWAFGYTNITEDDLLSKVRKALAFTNFVAPDPHPELKYGGADHQLYTTYNVTEPLERLAERRNDNLGNDVIKYAGQVLVASIPCKWVPYLQANDATDPIYGINWSTFRPYVKKGCDMRRNKVKQAAHQHSVREVHYDNWGNYACFNRRLNFVGSTS